jgi:predicted DNA-binding protein
MRRFTRRIPVALSERDLTRLAIAAARSEEAMSVYIRKCIRHELDRIEALTSAVKATHDCNPVAA